jgi:hypothetical protein
MATETVPRYIVAIQKTKDGPVQQYNFRHTNRVELLDFIKRVVDFKSWEELAFYEVHKVRDGGEVEIVMGDVNKPWPVHAKLIPPRGIITPGPVTGMSNYNYVEKAKGMSPPSTDKPRVRVVQETVEAVATAIAGEAEVVGIRPLQIKVA